MFRHSAELNGAQGTEQQADQPLEGAAQTTDQKPTRSLFHPPVYQPATWESDLLGSLQAYPLTHPSAHLPATWESKLTASSRTFPLN